MHNMKNHSIIIIIFMIINTGILTGCINNIDNSQIYPKTIKADSLESPINKYFNTKKITWSFDDYYMERDYPPHKGFDGLSQRFHENART